MKKLNTTPDDILCQQLYNSSQEAFTTIYNRYWQVLYLHAYKMLQEQAEATDIVQEVFSQLWSNAGRHIIHGKLQGYLYVSTRHAVLRHIAKSKLKERFNQYINSLPPGFNDQADRVLIYKEFQTRVDQAIESLPPRMKEIFILSRVNNLSHQEIALLLDISEHTVKTTISRSLRLLRKQLPKTILIALHWYYQQ